MTLIELIGATRGSSPTSVGGGGAAQGSSVSGVAPFGSDLWNSDPARAWGGVYGPPSGGANASTGGGTGTFNGATLSMLSQPGASSAWGSLAKTAEPEPPSVAQWRKGFEQNLMPADPNAPPDPSGTKSLEDLLLQTPAEREQELSQATAQLSANQTRVIAEEKGTSALKQWDQLSELDRSKLFAEAVAQRLKRTGPVTELDLPGTVRSSDVLRVLGDAPADSYQKLLEQGDSLSRVLTSRQVATLEVEDAASNRIDWTQVAARSYEGVAPKAERDRQKAEWSVKFGALFDKLTAEARGEPPRTSPETDALWKSLNPEAQEGLRRLTDNLVRLNAGDRRVSRMDLGQSVKELEVLFPKEAGPGLIAWADQAGIPMSAADLGDTRALTLEAIQSRPQYLNQESKDFDDIEQTLQIASSTEGWDALGPNQRTERLHSIHLGIEAQRALLRRPLSRAVTSASASD